MKKKTLNSKAFYIDTYSHKTSHEMFNASLILMCAMVFEKVDCRIGKSSYDNYLKIINRSSPKNIENKEIYVVERLDKLGIFFRFLLSAIQNIRYLIFSPKDAILIFPYNNLFSLRLVNFINKFCKRKVLIFCHGEMEGIVKCTNEGGFLTRLLIWLSHDFFLNRNVEISDCLYFSVMGKSIRKNLEEKIGKEKMSRFISVDHAYIFKKKSDDVFERNPKLKIGTVGVIGKSKGVGDFINFLSILPFDLRAKIDVSVTGKIDNNLQELQELGVDVPLHGEILPRADFNKKIKQLDYLLFFYPDHGYKITASGAIMDSIYHEKPILSLKNDYFAYIFNEFGILGCLFDDVKQMSEKLEQIVNGDALDKVDFKDIKEKFSPEKINLQLKNELIRIGYIKH